MTEMLIELVKVGFPPSVAAVIIIWSMARGGKDNKRNEIDALQAELTRLQIDLVSVRERLSAIEARQDERQDK